MNHSSSAAATVHSMPARRPTRLPERGTRDVLEADIATPNIARVYDYLLGGDLNTAADRQFADAAQRIFPAAEVAIANRGFIQRAVRYMARKGISQFLDLGCGLPSVGSVFSIARRARPGARVVCVDHDPVVCHIVERATVDTHYIETVCADIRYPDTILKHPFLRYTFDPGKPTGIIMGAVLDFVADHETMNGVAGLVARYMAEAPSDSYLAISHVAMDHTALDQPQRIELARQSAAAGFPPLYARTRQQIQDIFSSTGLVSATDTHAATLVQPQDWRPDTLPEGVDASNAQHSVYALCGLGHKCGGDCRQCARN